MDELKQITNKFSFQDILAYLLPGITTITGIYVILLLTPLDKTISAIKIDISVGLFVAILGYMLGVALSGFSSPVVKLVNKIKHFKEPRNTIPFTIFKEHIHTAFSAVFGKTPSDDVSWSSEHFYICRGLVFEYMGNSIQEAYRQNSLRQFRQYMIIPVIIWALAGIGWGVWAIYNVSLTWGITMISLSFLFSLLGINILVNRANENRKREVREILTAFLVGYKTGLFDKLRKPDEKPS